MKTVVRLFVICFVATIFLGCNPKKSDNKKESIQTGIQEIGLLISSTKVKISGVEDRIVLNGVVFPFEQINVYSKASGRLTKYLVDEGSIVRKDTVIAYVDRDEPGFEFIQSPVKSPMDGVILKKYVDVGTTVSPALQSVSMATPIVSVGDINRVKIQVSIIEQDLSRVREGQSSEVKIEAYNNRTFKGRVHKISPIADPISHTARTEILVDNKEKLIKAGISAVVDIIVGKHEKSIVIPREALVRKLDKKYVFTVVNGAILKKEVRTGYDDGVNLEILEGINDGDIIATSDFNVLQDGLKVQTKGE